MIRLSKDQKEGLWVILWVAAVVYLVIAVITGIDDSSWQKVDTQGNCYIHTTKVNNVWLTPGHNGPLVITTYCKK